MSAHTVTHGPLGVERAGGSGDQGMGWLDAWGDAIDAWTAYMVAGGLTARTIELRRYQLRRLAAAKLRRSPWRVSTGQLIEWLAVQSWAAETRRTYRATFRAFYAWGVAAGHTKANPAAALPAVRSAHTVPRPAPETVTLAALVSASDRDRLVLALATYAGLRRAEIAALEWAAIAAGVIRVKGKGRRVRLVPVHPTLEGLLDAERERREHGSAGTGYRYTSGLRGPWVFPGRTGGPMTPNAVGKAASRALGGGWGAHSLRHRFATRAYAHSNDLLAVQALLGHAKPETTRRYTELADGALAAAVRAV